MNPVAWISLSPVFLHKDFLNVASYVKLRGMAGLSGSNLPFLTLYLSTIHVGVTIGKLQ